MSFWHTLSKLPKTFPGNSIGSYGFDMLCRIQIYWSGFVFRGRGSPLPITVAASTTIKDCILFDRCLPKTINIENDTFGKRGLFCTTKASFNSVWEPDESSGLRIGDRLVALLWRTSAIPGAIWHWHGADKTMNYYGLYAILYFACLYNMELQQVFCIAARSQEWFSVFFLLYRCVLGFAVLNVVNAVFVTWASSHLQKLCMHLLIKLFQLHSIAKIDLQANFFQHVSVGLVGNPS